MRSLNQIALDDLNSTMCACGSPKEQRKSFCIRCYFTLPEEMRRTLYATVSAGYSQNYDEAWDHLKMEHWTQKQITCAIGRRNQQ